MAKSEGRKFLKNVSTDRSIILKRFLKEYVKAWTGFIWLRIGTRCDLL